MLRIFWISFTATQFCRRLSSLSIPSSLSQNTILMRLLWWDFSNCDFAEQSGGEAKQLWTRVARCTMNIILNPYPFALGIAIEVVEFFAVTIALEWPQGGRSWLKKWRECAGRKWKKTPTHTHFLHPPDRKFCHELTYISLAASITTNMHVHPVHQDLLTRHLTPSLLSLSLSLTQK